MFFITLYLIRNILLLYAHIACFYSIKHNSVCVTIDNNVVGNAGRVNKILKLG